MLSHGQTDNDDDGPVISLSELSVWTHTQIFETIHLNSNSFTSFWSLPALYNNTAVVKCWSAGVMILVMTLAPHISCPLEKSKIQFQSPVQ